MISGTAGGHRLKTLKGRETRPTSDRVKEAMFNILAGRISDSDVLDLYAGTGNLGIEALSRGAKSAVFIDKNPSCGGLIRENLLFTRLNSNALVIIARVDEGLRRLAEEKRRFDLIFMDPPYGGNYIEETLKRIEKNGIIDKDGWIVAEHGAGDEIVEEACSFRLFERRHYGNTALSFYKVRESNSLEHL